MHASPIGLKLNVRVADLVAVVADHLVESISKNGARIT